MRLTRLTVALGVALFAVVALSGSGAAVVEQPTAPMTDGTTASAPLNDVPCDATCVEEEEPDGTLEGCETDDGTTKLTGC